MPLSKAAGRAGGPFRACAPLRSNTAIIPWKPPRRPPPPPLSRAAIFCVYIYYRIPSPFPRGDVVARRPQQQLFISKNEYYMYFTRREKPNL